MLSCLSKIGRAVKAVRPIKICRADASAAPVGSLPRRTISALRRSLRAANLCTAPVGAIIDRPRIFGENPSPEGEKTCYFPAGNPKNCVFRRAISDRPYILHRKIKRRERLWPFRRGAGNYRLAAAERRGRRSLRVKFDAPSTKNPPVPRNRGIRD